ncbi:hypothetical protein ES703_101041 [subsurface metagenome]
MARCQVNVPFQFFGLLPAQEGAGPGGRRCRYHTLTVIRTHVHQAEDANARYTVIGIKQGRKAQGIAQKQGESPRQADLHIAVVGLAGEDVLYDIVVDMVLSLGQEKAALDIQRNRHSILVPGICDHRRVDVRAGDI